MAMTGQNEQSKPSGAPLTQRRAATILGVTPEHLNRVLRGHRQSRSLLARWESLKTEEAKIMSEGTNPRFSQVPAPASAAGGQALDPAQANTSTEWIKLCAQIGFTAVVIWAPYSPELWQNSGFEKALSTQLTAANLGHLDSVKWFNPISFFFYLYTTSLPAGLQLIKARLSAIGLLPHVKIGVADPEAKTWRVFFPELETTGA
jgi:hypothetical protein